MTARRRSRSLVCPAHFLSSNANLNHKGCGLNVLTEHPVYSLCQLPGMKKSDLSMEKTAATIIAIFSSYWDRWVTERGSFDGFRDQYYDYWIHSYVALPPLGHLALWISLSISSVTNL